MASRNTINRMTSGIDELAERFTPELITVCRQAQVCDQFGNFRWQQVCR